MELLILCALTLAAGFIGRLVDAHHEHGLSFFPHAGLLFAIITGLLWGYVMTRSAIILTGLMGMVFFWIYKLTWDCVNHAIILIIILLFALNSDFRIENVYVLALLFAHALFNHYKNVTPTLFWKSMHAIFYRYRLDLLLIPTVYSFFVGPKGFVGYFCYLGVNAANFIFHIPRHVVLPKQR